MKKTSPIKRNAPSLRKKAEQALKRQTGRLEELSKQDMKRLIVELGTHEIELEMQNEELRRAQLELDASRLRYADLYDSAPVGYFTFDKNGLIREVNVTGASLLGAKKSRLLNKPFSAFIHSEDSDIFFLHRATVLRSKTRQACDVRLRRKDGSLFHAQLESVAVENDDGTADFCRTVLIDVTAQMNYEKMLRESEERYRSLVELSPDAIAVHREGKFVYLNKAGMRLFGAVSPEEIIGKRVLDFLDDREIVRERIRQVEEQGKQTGLRESTIFRLDGRPVYVEAAAAPIFFTGKPAAQVILRDTTERKRAEDALRESEKRLKRAQEIAHFGSWELDLVNGILIWSDEVYRIFGVRPGEFGATYGAFLEAVHPDDRAAVDAACSRALREGSDAYEIEHRVVRKSTGEIRYVHEKCEHIRDRSGRIVRSVGIVHDITERKRAEEELRKHREHLEELVQARTAELLSTIDRLKIETAERQFAEASLVRTAELLEKIFSNIHVLLAYMDRDFNFIRVNPAYASADGREPEFFPGKNHFDLYPNEENEAIFRRVVETGEPYFVYEKPFVYAEHPERGTTFWDWSLQPVKDANGALTGLVMSLIDVTGRKRAETERMRLATAVVSAADAIVITDAQGFIEYTNPAFEQITGYSRDEAVGRDLHILDSGRHDDGFYRGIRDRITREGAWRGQLINKKKDGTLYHEECTYSPVRSGNGEIINYVSIKRDVTEKLRLESVAEAVNTMDNIGYIFSGLRHEIGNPISSLLMIMSLLKKKVDTASREKIKEYVNQALAQVDKVEYLLKSLKNFNMYENVDLQDIEVRPFLDKFLSLVTGDLMKQDISMSVSVTPEAERMRADPRALQQVLLNVLTNSADALDERENARISITASGSRGRVILRIDDNGAGMTEEELKKIFNPFYTTKAHGTGLGMVIVKKMLAKMNGTIEVRSRKNEGTTVEISIPEGGKK